MEKRWQIAEADPGRIAALKDVLHISYALCKLLVQRGINSFQEAKDFFRPQLAHLHDPYLMKDMDKAVERIVAAMESQQKILVFGDYDVDGTTSVAIMYRFLRRIYREEGIGFYIPHRYREGYGISKQGIDFARAHDFQLIISLDCGIKSADLVAYAATLGIEFIIGDHHLPDEVLPAAAAILNPKQKDCSYPYKELCGCGIAFKLIMALARRLGVDEKQILGYLDLVVTAIGADVVPLTGENRVLAHFGLERLNTKPCAGIRALMQMSQEEKKFSIGTVVFMIAPYVNAAGRMDEATKAVKLFIEEDPQKADAYARMLHTDNSSRKDADASITEEALAIIEEDPGLIARNTTVLYRPHWHKGVVGIVASRLIETYFRPTVVLTLGEGVAAGSARSVPGFNLYEAIHACREHLLGYGGHFAAAGMSLLPEKVEAFSRSFEEIVSKTIDPDMLVPALAIDAEISFRKVNRRFFGIVAQMEPYGPGNPKPVFLTRNVIPTEWTKIVKDHHIRFVVVNDGITLTGIAFNLAYKFPLLQPGVPVDLVYTIEENEWNGQITLQLKVVDFRLSEVILPQRL